MNKYELTDDELVFLDGKCGEKLQLEVDSAKMRIAARDEFPGLSNTEAAFIADMAVEAADKGKLTFYRISLRSCKVCGKSAGYAKYARNGKHHRKGDTDWKKPLHMDGLEFADRFVTMKGYATIGCCVRCWEKIQPFASLKLREVRAEIPPAITGTSSRFIYRRNVVCLDCGWEGHEGQMIWEPTIIGNGKYPAKCPKCDAMNNILSLKIKTAKGFTLEKVKCST